MLTGDDKGKKGEVIRSFPKTGKIIVEGVNMMKRSRKSQKKDKGGLIDVAMPMNASNVKKQK